MKLKLLDTALCRTPAFSAQDRLDERWDVLKKMIRESSPSFYQVIADLDVMQLEGANPKIRFSVWKYFNRARFRATPYGSFAAFSLLPIMLYPDAALMLASGITSHQYVDWKEKDAFTGHNTPAVENSLSFQTNATVSPFGQDFRYVRLNNGIFEIASVSGFAELNVLLRLCREKTCRGILHCEMKAAFAMKAKEIDSLLSQMLSLQLLLSEHSPNITGPDYFKRLNTGNSNFANRYIISERKRVTGGLDTRQLRQVPEWISWLNGVVPYTLNPALVNFRNAFLKKFEQRAVPLMLAIDPEMGVSYDNLGEQETDSSLTTILTTDGHGKQKKLQIAYTELHRFLLNKLIKGGTIRLEAFSGTKPESTLPLPNTLSVLFHFYEGHPVIENAGGCTANALLGRFTVASHELEQIGRQIALTEANANPDVLFFDIAYQAEKEVDNVNRRKQLYQYELPILTWSCDASPLTFEDILVAVRGLEIVLWSKKYQRRMVPRIPSAYNYSRSDLAVFRFLCDLQHQQIRSDLNFNMQDFFPRLSFYPRVMFKEMIVFPAMWMLPQEVHESIKTRNPDDGKVRLIDWLRAKRINSVFKAGHADQTLCFDPTVPGDIDAFLLYCRQNSQAEIYISEALISDSDAVHDADGKKYAAQIIANYSHPETVYKSIHPGSMDIDDRRHDDIAIFPGAEWLYFEVYCHPVRSNSLLLHQISNFLKKIKSHINKWFFIRYEDPAPHIRLRLHLIKLDEGYRIISLLRSLVEDDCRNGVVSDIQIKTYFPETFRYGSSRINRMEHLFFSDSKYTLGLLEGTKDLNHLYAAALASMQHMGALTISGVDEQLAFAKKIADNFSREYDLETAHFKKLNKRFQELENSVYLDISSSPARLPPYLQKAIYTAFSDIKSLEECEKLLGDVIHMHVNRLFNSDHRAHEAILYHYLVKVLTADRVQRSLRSELRHTSSK